ncbi:MAG: TRAP transporter substrate-binding protein DctP, partial [Pseudomonadota bacterium]
IAIVSMGFHEVQSDLTLSSHAYLGYVFSISLKTYQKLPYDIQQILVNTARELTSYERQQTQKKEQQLLEVIRQAGVNIHSLSEQQRLSFAEKTKHIPALFEEIIGADILSKTEELLIDKYISKNTNEMPIIIGVDADLSMDAKVSGLAIKRGASIAIDEINLNGGVLGRKMVLLVRDNKGLPSKGISNIEYFSQHPNLIAVIGGLHSAVVIAELEVIHKLAIPLLASWSSAEKVTDHSYKPNYVFRLSANDKLVGPFIINQVIKNYSKPAILLENSIWGKENLKTMQQSLKDKGLQFVQIETFNRGEEDFSLSLSRIRQSGANAIIMIANPFEGQNIVKSMARQESRLPLFSHWGIIGGDFWKQTRESLKKIDLTFFQTFSFLSKLNDNAQFLGEMYLQRYGLDSVSQISAPAGVAQSYELVHLLAQAIKQAGSINFDSKKTASITRSTVRQAMENIKSYNGVFKMYSPPFSTVNHNALDESDYIMAKFDQTGAIIPIQKSSNN